jgi:hypothetical protein
MKWQNQTFFPEKYQNFYGCSLRVGFDSNLTKPVAQELFKVLAQQLNFKQVRLERPEFDDAIVVDVIEFLVLQNHYLSFNMSYEFSSTLFNDYLTFSVPAGEPYSQLEKMFLMFDNATWVCIGATLIGAILVIQLINFMSLQLRNFFFGRNNQTPTLNLAEIFLTGGQNRVPGRNFARFLLMMFVLWTLIIRTCYQSELYKNLQDDMRKPRIKTINELNERNFTIMYKPNDKYVFYESTIERLVQSFDISPLSYDNVS